MYSKLHQRHNESLVEKPSYEDLFTMLKDCVTLLNRIDINDELLCTYANVLMNSENILLAAAVHLELNK